MRIAVLSDLHLGDGGPTDRFGHDDPGFDTFLHRLEGDFERIVLLGDIWETLSPRSFGDAERSLRAAMDAHPLLARRFERPKYTYIHGNHDIVAKRTLGARTHLSLRADGVRLVFTHGHQFDRATRSSITGDRAFWAVGWLMRAGLRALVRRLDHLPNWLHGVTEDPQTCAFQARAVAAAHRTDADVLVTGHTHVGGAFEHGDRLLLNSGSCHWGQRSFLEIDTRAGVYALRRVAQPQTRAPLLAAG